MDGIYKRHKDTIDAIQVSIVMPTFNRAEIISEAINSVQLQNHTNFELLIVDDGSTDDTEAVIEGFSGQDPRIRYLRGSHQGVSAARNIGLANCQGDYIFYLDTDNTWFPNHLHLMLTFMHVFDVPAAYSGLVCMNNAKGRYYRGDDFNWNHCHEMNYLDMNSFAHKASLLELCQGFDDQLKRLVDWDFMIRLTRITTTVFLPFLGVRYFDGDDFLRITKTVAIDGGIQDLQSQIRSKTKRVQPLAFVDESKYPVVESFFDTVREEYDYQEEQKLIANNPDALTNLGNYRELSLQSAQRSRDLISIIIVCFNNSALTRECIKSIFKAPPIIGVEIEVIVVDNGSSDDTREVVEELSKQFPEIIHVQNETNMMFSLGNNIGAAKSHGSHLVFLNNDTLVTPHWLEELYQKMSADDEVGIVGPKLLYPDDTVQCAGIVFNEHSSMPYHIYRGFHKDEACVNKSRQYKALTGACFMMRAKEFFEIGGLDTSFVNGCEDIDLCLKFAKRVGKKICYVPESEIYHFEGKTEGRGKNIVYNRELLSLRWGKIPADDRTYYTDDGFEPVAYEKKGSEDFGKLAAYTPVLKSASADHIKLEVSEFQTQNVTNIGFVSIWHVRGISIHTLQQANALECEQIKTHIYARWESDRFSNAPPVHHPRVFNAGDDPSADELHLWCKENQIDTLVLMEVHPKDWKRVEKAKQAGIKIVCYENLDILRHDYLDRYAIFDGFLFNTFYTRDVMLDFFPNKPSMTVPWGIEKQESKVKQKPSSEEAVKFIHIAGWGGVNNRKNTGLLIEAFDAAGDIAGELHLYSQSPISVYGDEPQKMCNKNKKIHVFEGTIDEIEDAYSGKDMLLWPSKKEGVGLPILESLMYGIPVLISDGYMMKQWIKPGVHGVICPAKPVFGKMYLPEMDVDKNELSNLIRQVTEDRGLLKNFATNVAKDQSAWEWSWQKPLLKKLFLKFSLNPQDPVFQSLHYLPTECLEFENERRILFGEQDLTRN
jgi:GT2 family glycosyltransferase/glycosyltransferase involved in cell wall biosynthesis